MFPRALLTVLAVPRLVSVLTPAETDELERATETAWDSYVEWIPIARAVLRRPRDRYALG
jgi:hypothetical protein